MDMINDVMKKYQYHLTITKMRRKNKNIGSFSFIVVFIEVKKFISEIQKNNG